MDEVLNTFHCERLGKDIQPNECIAHRKVARWADLSQLGVQDLPEWAWNYKDTCLDCPQGEQIEADWQEVRRKVSPRDKAKWQRRELIVDDTVLRMPLCSEFGRWVAVIKGLCKSCYQRQYRMTTRTRARGAR